MTTVVALTPFTSGGYDSAGIYYGTNTAAITTFIGTGPYEVEFFEFNISSLTANPQYYQGTNAALDTFYYTPSTSDPFDNHTISISYEFVSAAQALILANGVGGTDAFNTDYYALSSTFTSVDVRASVGVISAGLNDNVTQSVGVPNLLQDAQDDYSALPGEVLVIWASEATGGASTITGPFFTAVTCFVAGTHIATQAGEVPVERLEVGHEVLTHRGEARRIAWIGAGKVLATRGRRNAATPVIVRKGALADNVPTRDLHITKSHSLYIDGVLIPIEFLVNHRSILWDDRAQEVSIYHVELETHDVLLANGAPAESYRDDGNRWLFSNGNSGWFLPPLEPCAPVLTGGPLVDAAWQRLMGRSGPRAGFPLTRDPDLHLLLDGRRLDPTRCVANSVIFELPAVPGSVRLISRSASPQELGLARDPRCLGVAVQRIVVRQGSKFRTIESADPSLSDGFHPYEADNGYRWTDGNAVIQVESFDRLAGPIELVLTVASTAQYIEDGFVQAVA